MISEIKNRPTWAEIDLEKLAFNFRSVRDFVGGETLFMAIVKADAYGHGAVECSRKLEKAGVDWFGVALPTEGAELRNNGITKRILCLGGFWEGQESLLLANHLTPVVYRREHLERFDRAAEERGVRAEVHVKIDTGMGRIGVRFDEVSEFAENLKKYKNLHLEGVMTHFAAADDLGENEFTGGQIEKFETALEIFREKGFNPIYKDLANSPASVAHPDSYGNLIRLGGILYGLGEDILPKEINLPEYKPVLSLYSKIAHIKRVPKGESLGYSRTFTTKRDSMIATIPIGYEDGYPRALSNKSEVIIRGKLAPVVGIVSMDWTIADVTDVPGACVGDKVTLIGRDAESKISSADLAGLTDTISYEITCGINKRVEKIYVDNP